MPIKIDYDKCNQCMTCIAICPEGVFEEKEYPKIAHIKNCTDCGICIEECSVGCIELV